MNKKNGSPGEISPQLLKRYIDGQCTPEEVFQVDEWYASLSEETDATFDQQRHLAKVQEEIRRQSPGEVPAVPLRRQGLGRYLRYAAAAIILLVAGVGVNFFLGQHKSVFRPGIDT